jgi:anaerobic selenocysteine-containing dehydrogenase
VVDPRPSETARYADIHLALTLGSDALLLKAMIAIVLKEGWHNRSFLESHATGWEVIAPIFSDFWVYLYSIRLKNKAIHEVSIPWAAKTSTEV